MAEIESFPSRAKNGRNSSGVQFAAMNLQGVLNLVELSEKLQSKTSNEIKVFPVVAAWIKRKDRLTLKWCPSMLILTDWMAQIIGMSRVGGGGSERWRGGAGEGIFVRTDTISFYTRFKLTC